VAVGGTGVAVGGTGVGGTGVGGTGVGGTGVGGTGVGGTGVGGTGVGGTGVGGTGVGGTGVGGTGVAVGGTGVSAGGSTCAVARASTPSLTACISSSAVSAQPADMIRNADKKAVILSNRPQVLTIYFIPLTTFTYLVRNRIYVSSNKLNCVLEFAFFLYSILTVGLQDVYNCVDDPSPRV